MTAACETDFHVNLGSVCVPCAAGASRCLLCSRPPKLPLCTLCRLPIKGPSTIFELAISVLTRVGLAMTCSHCFHRTHAQCFHGSLPSPFQCPACLCQCVPGPYLPVTHAPPRSAPPIPAVQGGRMPFATLSSTLDPDRDLGAGRVASVDIDGPQRRASGVVSGEVQHREGLLGRARLRGLTGESLLHWKG